MTGKIAVGGITRKDGLVLVRILGARNGLSGRALSALGLKRININCVTAASDENGACSICFAVEQGDLDQTLGILQSMQDELQATTIDYRRHCSSISIYGPHFSERPAIAGTIFDTTADAGVEIHLISTSFSTVSFLTNEDQAVIAVERLHENFLVP